MVGRRQVGRMCESTSQPKSIMVHRALRATRDLAQQNDLPTSSFGKQSFLLDFVGQMIQLTTVALGSNRFIQLKELVKQHTFRVPPDARNNLLGMEMFSSAVDVDN